MEKEHEMYGEDLTGGDEFEEDLDIITFSPKPSFAVDEKYNELREEPKNEEQILEEEVFISETKPIEEPDENLPTIKDELVKISGADFFDKPVVIDEKQKVVESIEGMTEVAEEPSEEFEKETKAEVEEETTAQVDDAQKIEEESEHFPHREVDLRPRLSSFKDTRSISLSMKPTVSIVTSRASDVSRLSKPSIARKFTIQYPEKARITGWESEVDDLMMGFEMLKEPQLMLDEIVEEEERVEAEIEEEEPALDRIPYYEKHDKMLKEIAQGKIRSFILQKKLAIYFKRKKMDHATREFDWSLTQQIKYNRKLETWYEFILYDADERTVINEEIHIMKQERVDRFNKLQNMFKQMQARERETGYGLIYKKSGNVIPDKLVDRLINRQKTQMKEVCSMRLSYIKLKQLLQEKSTIMASLNEVSPGFLLANYEQLKVMNQSFADKIEERDEELTRLRSKCANTIQILAHIREKSAALDNDLMDLQQQLSETDYEYSTVRMQLNELKQKRDTCRHNIVKIKNDSGLLTKPTLLRDMQEELDNYEGLAQHLEACKETNKKLAKRIKAIRLKIEKTKEMKKISSRRLLKKDSSALASDAESKPTLYRGRPSLMMPFIDPKAFDCLKSIKPRLTYDRRLHKIKCNQTK